MRAVGSTISGGPRYQDDEGLGLPREKRETAEEVRARMEAKAEAARARSPWARTPKDIPEARVMGYAEVAFNAPAQPTDVDAAPPTDAPLDARFDASARPAPHQCEVCGATFTTGNGLGGHKRAHRTPPPAETPTPALAAPQPPQGVSEEARAVGIPSPAPRPAGTTPRPTRAAGPRPAAVATHDVEPLGPAQCVETVGEELCVLDDGHDGVHETAAQHLDVDAAPAVASARPAQVVVLPTPARVVSVLDGSTVEEVLGALEQFIEHLPPDVEHHPVFGDVVDRLHAGTLAIRAAIGGTR